MAKKARDDNETMRRGYSRIQFQVPSELKKRFEGLRDDFSPTHAVQAKTLSTAAVMLFLGIPKQAQLAIIELAHKYDLYPDRADPAEAWALLGSALQIMGARQMVMREGGPRAGPLTQAPSPESIAQTLKIDFGVDNGRQVTMLVNALEHELRGTNGDSSPKRAAG